MTSKMLEQRTHVEMLNCPTKGRDLEFAPELFLSKVNIPTWLSCLTVCFLSIYFPSVTTRIEIQWLPWLLSIFIFGLSHGGIDHQVPPLLGTATMKGKSLVTFIAWYLAMMIVVLLTWGLNPDLALIFFLVMSAYHFGQGDLYWSSNFGLNRAFRARNHRARKILPWFQATFLISRGSIAAILPFIIFPEKFNEITQHLASQLTGLRIQRWEGASSLRYVLISAISVLVLSQIMISIKLAYESYITSDVVAVRAAIIEILETGLLLILFSSAPPILAIGTYFLGWHAPRHVVRLMLITEPMRSLMLEGRYGQSLVVFHRRALPLTLAAAGLLLFLFALFSRYEFSAAQVLTTAFLFVSAITLPHFIIVLWMDVKQKSWGSSKL